MQRHSRLAAAAAAVEWLPPEPNSVKPMAEVLVSWVAESWVLEPELEPVSEWELVSTLALVPVLVQVLDEQQTHRLSSMPLPVALPQILAPFPDHRSHAPRCRAFFRKKHRRPSRRPTSHTYITSSLCRQSTSRSRM
eukprot:COSAG06_NODE_497_length_15020_cov_7.417733_4_plen_137_part_00